jgi:hypothetical protein
MTAAFLLLPFVLIGAAAVLSRVFVSRSSLAITTGGVEVRNYPQAPRLIPLPQVKNFEATPRSGNFKRLRPETAVLVLADGSRVPVRTLYAPDAGHGVDALNQRLETLRHVN